MDLGREKEAFTIDAYSHPQSSEVRRVHPKLNVFPMSNKSRLKKITKEKQVSIVKRL